MRFRIGGIMKNISLLNIKKIAAAAALSAVLCAAFCEDSVLAKADSYREYSPGGFSFDFSVTEQSSKSVMRVFLDAQSRDTSLVIYKEPKKYRRRVVLTIKNAFYVHDSGMSSAIRITPREMLFGQASAGDIIRIAYSGMYSIESSEESDGVLVLHLKAEKDRGATYDYVDLSVEPETCRPVEAVCKGSGGVPIKVIAYTDFAHIGGKELVTGLMITDSKSNKTSSVVLSGFSTETYPSSSFSVEEMKYVR